MKKIRVFDTTLRDGEQGIGCLMTIEQKSCLLENLNLLNLDIVELGFPAASREDAQWIQEASSFKLRALPAIFSRLSEEDLKTTLRCARNLSNFQIQFLGIGSEIHLYEKRKISLETMLFEIRKYVNMARSHGLNNIALILEDATRGSIDLLNRIIETALDVGVTTITIADTLGCMLPNELSALILKLKKTFGNISLGIHSHNDFGLATINTLTACMAGVNEIQTTIGGIGERAGNCALEEIIAISLYKKDSLNFFSDIDPVLLNQVCQNTFQILGKHIPNNKPVIGKYVFSTAAGLHQDGIIKNEQIYQYLEAHKFGRTLDFVFNRLSGKKILKNILQNYILTEEQLESFYQFLISKRMTLDSNQILEQFYSFINPTLISRSVSMN